MLAHKELMTTLSPVTVSPVGTVPFSRLTAADRALYERFAQRRPNWISDLNFASRIAWNGGFHYHKAVIEDALVIVAQTNVFTGLHFSAPLGLSCCVQLGRILNRIWDPYAELSQVLTHANSPYLRVLFVPEGDLHCYEGLKDWRVQVSKNEAYSDYLYDAEKLRTLSGKALHGKKNHMNRFLKTHPNAQYRSLKAEHAAAALAVAESWCEERGSDPTDLCSNDYSAIAALFEAFPQLDVRGGTLWEDGELRAFSIYSYREPDVAFCHFEKAARGYEDFYVAINTLTLQHEFPTVQWVNREEDMGIEGLRRAKQSYKPVRMIDKYDILLTRKEDPPLETWPIS